MSHHFVLLYQPGPTWLPGKPVSCQPLKDHVDYMLTLHSEGIGLMAGPFPDSSGGLAIVKTADIENAKKLLACDPAIRTGTLVADAIEWTRLV